ncbi:ABC transporter ATP-binding protein [Halocola ammonii]
MAESTLSAKPILEVSDLSISFRSDEGLNPAVKHISFDLDLGKTLAIVGESGSGKSVTSLAILNLLPMPPAVIENGKIILRQNEEERNLITQTDREKRSLRGNVISMIFQEPMSSLNPVYTCGDQVAEMLQLHRKMKSAEAREKTIELFNEVELPRPEKIFDSYPHEISGGQKQRVMIAMAMSCEPRILIADEPTTALDVTVQKNILQLLEKLQQKTGMSLIFITHDLGVVQEIADHVLVMYRGEVVESGTADQIFANPQHNYTKGLLACRPNPRKNRHRLPTLKDFLEDKPATDFDRLVEKPKHTEKLLEVKNFNKWYPQKKSWLKKFAPTEYVKAVNEVSFEVFKGETLGLVGESGCGKTTLSRALLHLIKPTSGEVIYDGKTISSFSKAEWKKLRREIQIIFQDPYSSLNPRKTVGQTITEPMKVHGIGKSAADRKATAISLLEKVGLSAEHYNRYPHAFSGGQRQRIVIARTLALEPRFIICDESVSALDVSVQAQVLNLLNDLKEEFELTYIFISHDLSVIKHMSDRIMVMRQGKIEEIGEAEKVYHYPATAYTKQLIEAIPGKDF